MSDKPPIPSLPPLASVQDRNVRMVLQSIYDGWRVRNGDVGTGEHKWLTVKDLKDIFTVGRIVGPGGNLISGGGAVNGVSAVVEAILNRVTDSVMTSRMWRLLEDRLSWVETPEWFQGKFGAAIVTEQVQRESGDNALAEQVTTAVTNINGNIALVQEQVTATSDLAGATASTVTTLQTDVANTKVIAQNAFTVSQTTEGKVSTAWTVKVDANGYVSGFGYGVDGKSGSYVSDFTVRADRFSIGAPSGYGITPTVPFVVYTTPQTLPDGSTLPAGVYMDSAVVKRLDGAVVNAGTLIAGNIYTGSKMIDATSKQQVNAVAVVSAEGTITGASSPVVVSGLHLVTPDVHASYVRNRRVRDAVATSPLYVTFSVNAVVDHYLSLWWRRNSSAAWQFLTTAIEPQSGYGSISAQVTFPMIGNPVFPLGPEIEFGVSASNQTGSVNNPSKVEIRNYTAVVQAINL